MVIVPVPASITAPSVGTGLNANVPPKSPVIFAVAPSQVGVRENVAFPFENVIIISSVTVQPASFIDTL